MQVTCTLCGEILQTPDDMRGAAFTVGQVGAQVKHHIGTKHANTKQSVFNDPAVLPLDVPLPVLVNIMGVTFQSLLVFSYFQSDDPAFVEQIAKLREIVEKVAAQKVPAAPAVTV